MKQIGACVAIAVLLQIALTIALASTPRLAINEHIPWAHEHLVVAREYAGETVVPEDVHAWGRFGRDMLMIRRRERSDRYDRVFVHRLGWPFRITSGEKWNGGFGSLHDKYVGLHLVVSRDVAVTDYLPTTPIWSGIVANVAVFAVSIWCVFRLPFAVRAARRRRRSLCVHCGCSLIADRCSECGTTISLRA